MYIIMDCGNFCLKCGKKLRKKELINGKRLVYHSKCWNEMIQDIKKFDKVAVTKYKYVPLYGGLTKEEVEKGKPIVISFD
jgi:hypothetical protein